MVILIKENEEKLERNMSYNDRSLLKKTSQTKYRSINNSTTL